jgi:hypothetical protein
MTHRAYFQGPREHLNPLGVPMAAKILIEVYPIGRKPVRWRARYLADDGTPTKGGQICWESKAPIEAPQAAMVKQQIVRLFEEQTSTWQEILSEEETRTARMA